MSSGYFDHNRVMLFVVTIWIVKWNLGKTIDGASYMANQTLPLMFLAYGGG